MPDESDDSDEHDEHDLGHGDSARGEVTRRAIVVGVAGACCSLAWPAAGTLGHNEVDWVRRRLVERSDAYARADPVVWASAGGSGLAAMRALRVQKLRYDAVRAVSGRVWARTTYRFGGFDASPAGIDQAWAREGVKSMRRVGGAAAPWEWPRVSVRRGAGLLVGVGRPSVLDEASRLAEGAAQEVAAALETAPVRPVVLLPPDGAAFAAASGVAEGGVAAVTVGPVRGGQATGCDRVVLHPTVWGELVPEGRRVVLTHELAHLALRRDTSGISPRWLDEGLCEYVAYAASTLPAAAIAAPLLRRIAAGGLPDALPTDEDFEGTDVAWAYAAAWCACRVLAERARDATLVTLARPRPSDPQVTRLLTRQARFEIVLRRDTGWSVRDLVTAWRGSLAHLAAHPAQRAAADS
ncbi:MAG: hypothetical protein ABI746_04385 [Dermatophilaceae bacterium]